MNFNRILLQFHKHTDFDVNFMLMEKVLHLSSEGDACCVVWFDAYENFALFASKKSLPGDII